MTLYAFDGTWNAWGGEKATNVFDVAMSYRHRRSDAPGVRCTSHYIPGVGTRLGIAGKLIGGLSGNGAKKRARQAYQELCTHYEPLHQKPNADGAVGPRPNAEKQRIDIVGFSRGAATALHFANLVRSYGIRKPRPTWRPNSWRLYRIGFGWLWFRDWPRLNGKESERLAAGAKVVIDRVQDEKARWFAVPEIRFVGLWDAVGSFGVPIDSRFLDFQTMEFGFNLSLPPNVARCSHAMAVDERRKTFRNIRVIEERRNVILDTVRRRRFRWTSLYVLFAAAALLGLGLFGRLSDDGTRTWVLAGFSVFYGLVTMLLDPERKDPGDDRPGGVTRVLTMISFTGMLFMILHLVTQWVSRGPTNGWFVVLGLASMVGRELLSNHADEIVERGHKVQSPVAMARVAASELSAGPAELLVRIGSLAERAVVWFAILLAQLVVRPFQVLIGARERAPVTKWTSNSPTITEVWFRGGAYRRRRRGLQGPGERQPGVDV